MRRSLRVAAGALVALALTAAPAHAQDSVSVGFFDLFSSPGLSGLRPVVVPLTVSGRVTLEFHGDPASGCAAAGLCDVDGTTELDPGSSATLLALEPTHARGRGFAFVAYEGVGAGAVLRTAVTRGSSTCSELRSQGYSFGTGNQQIRNHALELDLGAFAGSLTSHCAGPQEADLLAELPRRAIPLRRLRRAGTTIDLSARRSLASHGIATTVTSTVRVATKRRAHVESDELVNASEEGAARAVTARYTVERLDGSIPVGFEGLPDPVGCEQLDACGVSGTATLTPGGAAGTRAEITAVGGRHSSRRGLERALGLRRGRPPRDVFAFGEAELPAGPASVTAESLTRAGGPGCNDSAPLRGLSLTLAVNGTTLDASLVAAGPDALRTSCSGPEAADLVGEQLRPLASGSIPAGALRAPTVTIHLTHGTSARHGGYALSSAPDLTLVLRRTGVSAQR